MKSLFIRQSLCTLFGIVAMLGTSTWNAESARADVLEQAVVVFELYLEDSEALEKTPAYTMAMVEALDNSPYVAVLSRADGEKLLAGHSLKAKRATKAQFSEREEALNIATNAVLNGEENAVSLLKESMRDLTRLASEVVVDEKLHGVFLKNHMLLAQAYLDRDQKEDLASLLERVMRHFGPKAFNEEETHPGIVKVWREVGKKLASERTASVVISSNPPGADVYVQGKKLEEKTPVTLDKLLPGELLIQLRKGKDASVAHMVKTEAGKSKSLAVNLNFEKSLRISGDRFGLVFKNQSDFEANGAKYASRLGKLLDVDKVFLVGLRSTGSKVAFAGASVDVKTQKLQKQVRVEARANVVVRSQVRDLAWLLIQDDINSGDAGPWYQNTWGWVSAGVGLTGIILGAVMRSSYDERLAAIQGPCAQAYPCEIAGEVMRNRDDVEAAASTTMMIEGVSNTSFVLGGLGIIGSVLLFTLSGDSGAGDKDTALPRLQAVGPTLLRDGSTGLGATWSF